MNTSDSNAFSFGPFGMRSIAPPLISMISVGVRGIVRSIRTPL